MYQHQSTNDKIRFGHVKRMSKERIPKLVLNRKLFGKRRKGKLRTIRGNQETEDRGERKCFSLQIKSMKCNCLYVIGPRGRLIDHKNKNT